MTVYNERTLMEKKRKTQLTITYLYIECITNRNNN